MKLRKRRELSDRLKIRIVAVCLLIVGLPAASIAGGVSLVAGQGNHVPAGASPASSIGGAAPPPFSAEPFAHATTVTRSSDLEHSPSLEVVERYADEHNPDIRAARYAWQAAVARITQARSYENPMVMYTPDTDNMAQTRAGSQTTGVAFSQAIPFPGKLTLRGRIAAHESDATLANLRAVIQEVDRQVWVSYAGYYLADRALEVNGETTQLARQFESIAETRYQVGKVPEQDVIQSQVEISQLAIQRVDLVKGDKTALGTLNTLLDRDPRAAIGRPAELSATALPTPLERLVEDSRQARPELNAQRALVKARETSVTLAKMGYLPDFSVGGQYFGIANNGVPGFVKDGHDIWAATIGFSIPIWLDRVKAQVDQANAQFLQQKSATQNTQDTVADQVQNAYERVMAAARNEEIYRTTLMPQTAQRIAAARAGYQTGTVDFFTLIDSLQSYEDVRMRRYQSIQQYQAAAADLSRAVGQPIQGIVK